MAEYFAELDRRFPDGFDPGDALAEAHRAMSPPRGAFVLAGPIDRPTACGGVQFLDERVGEIKRMWVAPAHRGQGVATRMLAYLEGLIGDSGRTYVVLDTNGTLADAVALYERAGYDAIDRYNDNPYAQHWFGKELAASS